VTAVPETPREEPLWISLERSNRRDAQTADEFASPPASTDSPTAHGQPWSFPHREDIEP
jgi:hypothetical protein